MMAHGVFGHRSFCVVGLLVHAIAVHGLQCGSKLQYRPNVVTTPAGGLEPSRRSFLSSSLVGVAASTGWLITSQPAVAAAAKDSVAADLAARLEQDILYKPPMSTASNANSGVDNLYFPDFMEGTWDVTQTLVGVSAPLGLKFAGGPQGSETVAQQSMQESQQRLNAPVSLQLRFVKTVLGVVEDGVFNSKSRLDAFAGRPVVASVAYADTGGSNRAALVARGGRESDPLSTVMVRFRGPAAQKTFLTAHGSAFVEDDKAWVGFATTRSIFALTNESTAPPIFTDSELLYKLTCGSANQISGRFRLAGYLNPNDQLYFEARNRAVSLQDYTLEMKKQV